MKKYFILFFALVLTLSLVVQASAYVPIDGDIANVFAQDGMDILAATSEGVPLKWVKNNGAMWASRLSYLNEIKLDGLSITLKNVTVPSENAAIVFGITNSPGQWIDVTGLFFINYNSKYFEGLGTLDDGYSLCMTGNFEEKKVIKETPLNKKIEGTVTIKFKKNSNNTWTYTFNGQDFTFTDELLKSQIPNPDKAFLNFGVWGDNTDISYTVADLTDENAPIPPAPVQTDTPLETEIEEQPSPIPTGTPDEPNSNSNTILVTVIILLIGTGIVSYILFKNRRKVAK